jgi:acyl-CoA-binding protein
MMDRPLHRVSTLATHNNITLTICRSSIPPLNLNSILVSPLPPTLLSPTPQFYGLFKQANEGDINTPKPGMMQFTERGKWTAWESQKGKSEENAKKEYVQALFAVSHTCLLGEGE